MKRLILSACLLAATAFCQDSLPQNVLKLAPASAVSAKPGETVQVALSAQVDPGFHVNSNTPADSYLIPLRLTWAPGPLESPAVTFPKPQKERYPFSTKPVSVFTGSFDIVTRFKVSTSANPGSSVMTGKLHYQACNDRTCLTPKTIDVTVPVEVVK
jgi:thiol:disulfide interchange protein DsbD